MKRTDGKKAGTITALALLSVFILLLLFAPAVSAQLPGDVNFDGIVNIRDAVLVQWHVLGFPSQLTLAQQKVADMNGDGLVNVVDARMIMQFEQGPISSPPTQLLPAPVLNSPINNSNAPGRQVTFSWQAVTGAINYELEIVNERDGSFLTKASLGNVTSSLQRGFEDEGTPYRWRVRAANSGGWGAWSGYATFINGDRPGAPILSRPEHNENIGRSWTNFEWQPVVGADRYQLKISKDGTVYRTVTVHGRTTSLQQDFPVDGSEFTWTVMAGNANGWGNVWAAERKFIVGSPFGYVTLLAPAANSNQTGASVTFSWEPMANATRYNIEILDVRLGTVTANIIQPGATYTQSGFLPADAKQYKWRVRAGDDTRWGLWSAYRDFISQAVTAGAPVAPALLSPAVNATAVGTDITFRWTKVLSDPVVQKYELQVVETVGGNMFRNVEIHHDALVDIQSTVQGSFPNDSKEYMWRVRAHNAVGWGPWSLYRNFINGAHWWNFSF